MIPASVQDTRPGLGLFEPPYEAITVIDPTWKPRQHPPRGLAIVWWVGDAARQASVLSWLRVRPPGIELVAVLPEPEALRPAMPLLNDLPRTRPTAVLPAGELTTPPFLREILRVPPRDLGPSAVRYLVSRGLLPNLEIQDQVRRVFELAPTVSNVTALARRMFMSRRTLGRHFATAGIPVPSHWLQFARLLYAITRLQSGNVSVFRVACQYGYPDGFTMSNQMVRVLGFRPSQARKYLGWEWVIEEWLHREAKRGGFDLTRFGAPLRDHLK